MSLTVEVVFDGDVFRPVKPLNIKPNTRMEITIADEREDWLAFSARQFENAFGDDEPDYSADLIKRANPDYEGR